MEIRLVIAESSATPSKHAKKLHGVPRINQGMVAQKINLRKYRMFCDGRAGA